MEESSRVHKAIGCSSEDSVSEKTQQESAGRSMQRRCIMECSNRRVHVCVCVCVLRTYMGVCLGKREREGKKSSKLG